MARDDAQLIKRRVFTDGGDLLREGLVPVSIPNTRKDLMAWWAKEDQRIADEEAAAAAAAAAEATAPPMPEPAELIAPLEQRVAALEGELSQLQGIATATPEAVLEGTMQIARAAGAAALVEAAGQTVIAQVDGVAAAADARLEMVEGQVAETAGAVGQLLVDGRERLDQVSAEMLAKTTKAISKRIAGLEVAASQLRGPKGDRGRVGQGLIAGAGKRPEKRPDGSDWAPGDSWLDTRAEGFQLEYLDAAGKWSKPARLVPAPRLIQATANVVDMAPRINSPQTIIRPGSGGGAGSGEHLLTRAANYNLPVTIADSSNWTTTTQDPTSGNLLLEVVAVDGAFAGKRGFASIAFNYSAGVSESVEYALLGDLANVFKFDLTVGRSPASVPSGITATLPPGASRTTLTLQILPDGGGGTGGVGQFLLSGVVLWTFRSKGRAQDPATATEQPAWNWV
ncbi:hypothetical protein [Synechococcus sp. LA31]|uniref:hypothetical protein n=1 Tax=Synechococcus sp. LA31 TaxID=2741953 RepID=UPI001BDD3FEA|nr:hypothetical protein [Synechococcus sp. LA31]QVV66767.1 hypothetical protein KJJ24_09750 [Synechococcus sp. LA31]